MPTSLRATIEASPHRLSMPIGAYAGLAVTGGTVRDVVSDPAAQVAAVLALHERLGTPFLLTAMDLSAEAEAFGSSVRLTDGEMPALLGRLVTTAAQVERLAAPTPGDCRTRVHLDAAAQLVGASPERQGAASPERQDASAPGAAAPVLGGLIGPFSLAARLFGVAEALEATLSEPDTILSLLEKVTPFLIDYALEFRRIGAAGVVMAEPAAGLLSPNGLARFSTPFVARIVDATQDATFAIVLHNCGAKIVHLDRIIECGAEIYHFGAPMDLPAALARVDGRAVLCGNIDPSFIHAGPPSAVRAEARRLLAACAGNSAFVLSSGCDLPPGTPLENVEALCAAVNDPPPSPSASALPS
jgi:uroporphyrinogen decarboxylase